MSSFGYLQIFVVQRDVKGKFQALVNNITVMVLLYICLLLLQSVLSHPSMILRMTL